MVMDIHKLRWLHGVYTFALHEAKSAEDLNSVVKYQDQIDKLEEEIESYENQTSNC